MTPSLARSDSDAPALRPLAAMGWMLFACFLFVIMSVAAKRAMTELSFLEVASGRAGFGAIVIFLWARSRGVPLVVHDQKTQWARTIAGITSMFFGFFALSRLPLGDAVTLANLTPLILALLSQRALGERAGSGLLIAVVLGLSGVAMLAGASFSHGFGLLPFLCAVAGAFSSAVAMIFLRRLGPRESAEGVSLHFAFWATLLTFVIGIPWLRVPSWPALISLVLAGVSGGFAQVIMTKAYGLDKAARVSAMGYSGVVMSQIFGVLVLHESPSVRQLAGAGLVVTSGLFLVGGALRESTARSS
jgi:drug/metabolite transporter (DMT)-like permease